MNTRNDPDGEENQRMTRDNERATFAAQQAIYRFENNKHVETLDGSFWKTCAWAMADDLKRALKPSEPVSSMKTDKEIADELDAQDRLRNRGYRTEQCSMCKGLGHVTSRGDTGVMQRPCFNCGGRGFKWVAPLPPDSD